MSENAPTILLVDDDEVFRQRLARAFADRGFEVSDAANVAAAEALLQQDTPEFAVIDLRMPGRSGLELVHILHQLDATSNMVVLTGYGSIATALEAVRLGATHYLTKPADVDDILAGFARRKGADVPGMVQQKAASNFRESEHSIASEDDVPFAADDFAHVPSLARVEWEHIQRVLTDCSGNISQAAQKLGIHRRSLQRKLAKYPVAR